MNRRTTFMLVAVLAVVAAAAVMPHEVARSAADFVLDPTMVPLVAIGSLAAVSRDLTGPAQNTDTLIDEYNRQRRLQYYRGRNGLIPHTVATLPGLAIATAKAKLKTAGSCVTKHAGVLGNAVAAADDAWTLTGDDVVNASGATQYVRYLALVDSGDTKTVQRSSVASTAAGCEFDNLPADGLAIVGIATIAIANGTTFDPGTTELDAAGITLTCKDGDQDDAIDALGGRLVTN